MQDKNITTNEIEDAAKSVLEQFGNKYKKAGPVPVPIGDIIEASYGIYYEFNDLAKLYPDGQDYLATLCSDGDQWTIQVNNYLNPENDPKMLGRYRFSLAHELGHYILHRGSIYKTPNQGYLIQGAKAPSFLCRASSKDPKESQADQFAAALLIPRDVLKRVWDEELGINHPPLNVYDELEAYKDCRYKYICEIARRLAPIFQVSGEAMQIRLEKLKYIETTPNRQLTLF